ADLARLRRRCEAISRHERAQPYLKRTQEDRTLAEMRTGDWCLHWTSSARIVSDPPEKAASKQVDGWLSKVILSVLGSARGSVDLTSPYFIPRDAGKETLVRLASQGVRISVLTN